MSESATYSDPNPVTIADALGLQSTEVSVTREPGGIVTVDTPDLDSEQKAQLDAMMTAKVLSSREVSPKDARGS